MEKYTDISRVSVRPIDRTTAKGIIEKYHYSHLIPATLQLSLGVFYESDDTGKFFDDNEKLIGCIMYGHPSGRMVVDSITEGDLLDRENIMELLRLFIHDGYGKNIESYVIGQSFKWLKINRPKVKVLISFSDPAEGHLGIIYQSTNWLFQMIPSSGKWQFSMEKNPYHWVHPRTIFGRYGFCGVEDMKKSFDKNFYAKRLTNKFRYLYILTNKSEARKIKKNLIHELLPYPKSIDYMEEIVEVEVSGNSKLGKFI